MYAARFCCRVSLYWNWDYGGCEYTPYEARTTSCSPTVYVPPMRGSKMPYVTVAPPAVELTSVACWNVPAPPGNGMVSHGVPGGAPSNVSSTGPPPLTPGLKHITLFHALNQNARAGPPAVDGMSNW